VSYPPRPPDENSSVEERIVARIPPRFGPSLRCGPGWLALLDDLDRKLDALFPDYVVYQCKEKFGSLRYYTDIGEPPESYPCCDVFQQHQMADIDNGPARDELLAEHQSTAIHKEVEALHAVSVAAAQDAIRHAELQSEVTCEDCGAPGTLMQDRRYRVACPTHRESRRGRSSIVERDGPAGRRAVIVGGPDVWEVVRAVAHTRDANPTLDGDSLLDTVSATTGLARAVVDNALAYYAAHPDEIDAAVADADSKEDQL
jgi:hypothetical protein